MICPECTYPMAFVKNHTPINASGWKVERFRCDRCKLSAIVETTFEADEVLEPRAVNSPMGTTREPAVIEPSGNPGESCSPTSITPSQE